MAMPMGEHQTTPRRMADHPRRLQQGLPVSRLAATWINNLSIRCTGAKTFVLREAVFDGLELQGSGRRLDLRSRQAEALYADTPGSSATCSIRPGGRSDVQRASSR